MTRPFGRRACPPGLGATLRVMAVFFGIAASGSSADAQTVTATNAVAAKNTLDGQLFLATPAALGTGLSTGIGVSYLRSFLGSPIVAWGARASWSTATEYSLVDTVRNDDIRMRVCGVVQHAVGRGAFGLRLGLGASTVYESRTRAQGSRAGLSGSALEASDWHVFPAADLDGVVVLRIWNGWGMSLSGGPTLHLIGGSAHLGWSTGLGVAWQP